MFLQHARLGISCDFIKETRECVVSCIYKGIWHHKIKFLFCSIILLPLPEYTGITVATQIELEQVLTIALLQRIVVMQLLLHNVVIIIIIVMEPEVWCMMVS